MCTIENEFWDDVSIEVLGEVWLLGPISTFYDLNKLIQLIDEFVGR